MDFNTPHTDEPTVNPDFRTRLAETATSPGRRQFAALRVGEFLLSIQASPNHASRPATIAPVEDVDAWEVAVFTPLGRWITPQTDPDIFYDPLWADHWAPSEPGHPSVGRFVPTDVVQTFTDMLYLGREQYEVQLEFGRFLSGETRRMPEYF